MRAVREPTREEEQAANTRLSKLTNEPGFHDAAIQAISDSHQRLEWEVQIKQKYPSFIFDEEQVLRPKNFIFMILNDDTAAIGVYLPKERELNDKKGRFLRRCQVKVPCLITSTGEIEELNPGLEQRYRITIPTIPDESVLPRRWNLSSIKHFAAGQASQIELREVYDAIKHTYAKYVYFDNDMWYAVHALWDIATYFFMLFKYFPIMELRGYSATGKTKIMTISRFFTFNPTAEMTNPSESTLFREGSKTRYVDECEKIFAINPRTGQVEQDTRAEIINSSYKYTGSVPRQEKDPITGKFTTFNYPTYAPTMIGSINGLYGGTESRAIVHITTKAPAGDKRMELEPNEEDALYSKIRCQLHLYQLQSWKIIRDAAQSFSKPVNLKERDFFMWKPLLLLANEIDQDLFEELREFAEKQAALKKLDKLEEGSLKAWILKIVNNRLQDEKALYVQDILDSLPDAFSRTHSKTITKVLDMLGFAENKKHGRDGTYYDFSMERFRQIVAAEFPSFFASPASPASQNRGQLTIYQENICEGK